MNSIRGPVFTIYATFTDSDRLDLQNAHNYIEFLLTSGANQFYLMPYNGRYGQLRLPEWGTLVREVSDHLSDNAEVTVIIGERLDGPTDERIEEFLALNLPNHVILSTLPNERFFSVDQYVLHFASYATLNRPILAHLMPSISGFTGQTCDLTLDLYKALGEMDHIVAVKEDHKSLDHIKAVAAVLPERISLAIAGRKRLLMSFAESVGTSFAYLNGLSLIDPAIAFTFWRLLNEDRAACDKFVTQLDDRFWDGVAAKYGWHRCNRALMECAGFGKRIERLPMVALSDQEFVEIRQFYSGIRKVSNRWI